MPHPLVTTEHPSPGIVRLILSSPKNRNALSLAMMSALREAVEEAAAGPETRCVLLAAEGPAFCAGHDLKELTVAREGEDGGQALYTETFAACAQLMLSIVHAPVPVIAEVQAMATAAGCQLVASCDLALAAETARFATPGVNIGLFCSTPMVALSRNVAPKHAMELLLTGEAIDAHEAARIGLVNKVCSPDALKAESLRLAQKIAAKARPVLEIGKEAFSAQAELGLEEAYAMTAEVMTRNMMMGAAKEGIGAFLEKRAPDWDKA